MCDNGIYSSKIKTLKRIFVLFSVDTQPAYSFSRTLPILFG